MSSSGYYAWRKRREEESERRRKEREELRDTMERFRDIVRRLGFVPGKRTFRAHMFRDFGRVVSVRRCARVMRMMGLVANRPKKDAFKRDAYKGQARHDHRCAAPADLVGRGFEVGPRQVILTDITYLYRGEEAETFYLCCFKDAFTREILGAAARTKMDVALVKEAYDRMMEAHGSELGKDSTSVYIHSDQGSQYLSTTFQELLGDDGFVQSCSRRGNSLDNSPMESFFAQMKCRVLDVIARCETVDAAIRMALGYVREYNTDIYQLELAGLAPAEYYVYVTEGIYPCDSYFGVEATELMPVSKLVEARLERRRERSEAARERAARRREKAERLPRSAPEMVQRDQNLLWRERNRWHDSMVQSQLQVEHIDSIIEKTYEAEEFLKGASDELLEELRDPQRWRDHKELGYVLEMRELF